MTARLPEHLDLIAAAPEGILRLRGLILELAVRGKLVPQDPNDEPASELLKRIAKERVRLEAEGICKKSKATPTVGENEQPFEVPVGWVWVRLADIGHDWGQKTPDSVFTYVDVSAIDNARGVIDSPSVLSSEDAPSRARKLVRRGTVIYSTVRPYLLNIAVIDRELTPLPIASTAFAVVHPLAELSSQYIFWYLRSPVFVRYVESVQTGIAYPAINDGQFFSGLFPLPPLAEQHRIVAKVDELMALCDRLEAEQTDAEAAHVKLVDTLLGTLTQSTDAAEFAANWQRLAEQFDTLFTTESSLDALKQTILQLAVMGKLVPQDPKDEPASELLKRIAQDRARLEAEGACRKSKPMPPVAVDEQPFALPEGWTWARFAHIATVNGRLVDSQNHPDAMQVAPDSIERGTGRLLDRRTVRDAGIRGPNQLFKAGQLLYSKIRPSLSKAVIVDFDGLCSADMYPLDPFVEPRFLLNQILSEVFLEQVRVAENRVKMPKLNQESLNSFLVCVPPLAEQHRIVAKVDELMALCDRLKADLAESRTRQARLSATLIESALQAA